MVKWNLDQARAFLAAYPEAKLFPARWDTEIKRHIGLIKWGENSSGDPNQIDAWSAKFNDKAYFCINLQASDMAVVDVDIKNDAGGDETLSALEIMEGKALPETLRVQTPSGGFHHLLKGAAKNCYSKIGPGIDIPVMIPLPGSIVQGKGEYKILNPGTPIANTPEWITETAGRPLAKKDRDDTPAIEVDQPHNIERAIEIAKAALPAKEGDYGDNRTLRVAYEIRDVGIAEGTCLDIMLEHYNPRCEPPWDPDKLAVKVANAYQYAQNRIGEMTAEADFKDVPLPETAPLKTTTNDFGICTAVDFTDAAPPRRWVIDNWLPEGELTSLYGAPGGGKSLLGLQLSLSVAAGAPWLGMPTTRMPVMLVSCEDSREELHRRYETALADPSIDFATDLSWWYGWPRVGLENLLARAHENRLIAGQFRDTLRDAIAATMPPGPKLLILDTLADIYAGNENDRAMVNAFLKTTLGRLRLDYDLTIVIIGHPAKAKESEYSGNTAWDGGVRMRWLLKGLDDEFKQDYRILTRAKTNYSARGETINLIWNNGVFQKDEDGIVVSAEFLMLCDYLLMRITEKYTRDPNHPYVIGPSSLDCIYKDRSLIFNKKPLEKPIIEDALRDLQQRGLIQSVVSEKHRKAGIFPIITEEEGTT